MCVLFSVFQSLLLPDEKPISLTVAFKAQTDLTPPLPRLPLTCSQFLSLLHTGFAQSGEACVLPKAMALNVFLPGMPFPEMIARSFRSVRS